MGTGAGIASLCAIGLVSLLLAPVLLAPGEAKASVPDFIASTPEEHAPGSGAGQLASPTGVAAEPNLPGHLYVPDEGNVRINEFTPWGEFVRAFGWGVNAAGPEEKLQACTTASGCKAGSNGSGVGQFKTPEGIAINSAGELYVAESGNHRVQKFDSEGHFILMFGDSVNKTAIEESRTVEEDVCPAPGHPNDVCQAGISGAAPGQLGAGISGYVNRLAVCQSNGTVYLGEGERIQVFTPGGGFKETITMPVGMMVAAVTTDPSCNLRAAFNYVGPKGEVRTLKPSGPTAEFLEPTIPILDPASGRNGQASALALDPAGNLYAAVLFLQGKLIERMALEFDPAGNCLTCGVAGEGGQTGFDRPVDESVPRAIAISDACGSADIYITNVGSNPPRAYLNIYGPSPSLSLCPQPVKPPLITDQYAVSVGVETANLRAKINPRFWPDTTYYVEYGTAPCSEGGCKVFPAAPGSALTSKLTSAELPASILLPGLSPETTYHYRFVAQSGGGGPVRGRGGKVGEDGLEGTFTTSAPNSPSKPCPNKALRAGPSANLPDCRAYELVSPLDKGNVDIKAPFELRPTARGNARARVDQATPDGDALAYGAGRSFGDAVSAPFASQYLARRGGAGWMTHALNPPIKGPSLYNGGTAFVESMFKGFSENLCSAWLLQNADLALAPGAPKGVPSLYQRDNCEPGGGEYKPITTVQPPGFGAESEGNESQYFPTVQGFSADGSATAFKAPATLTAEARTVPVGEKLNCLTAAEGATYKWLSNGTAIGATESTYIIKAADEGKAIQCQALANKVIEVANPAQVVSPFPGTAPPLAPEAIFAPTTSAPLAVGSGGGQTLSCDAREGSWGGSPTAFSYQWYRNGVAIGTNAPTYMPTAVNLATAAVFQCAVSGENAGGRVTEVSATLSTNPAPASGARPDPRVLDIYRAYLSSGGDLHLLSVLPNGNAAHTHASVGTALFVASQRLFDSVAGAVSMDGSRVFWSAEIEEPSKRVHTGGGSTGGVAVGFEPSKLYLRLNASKDQSAVEEVEAGKYECSEPAKACTIPISGGKAIFRGANPMATKALYTEGQELYELDVDAAAAYQTGAAKLIAGEVEGLLGATESLSHIYFVSDEVLSAEANNLGQTAKAGEPNLYLREVGGGGFTFVASLLGGTSSDALSWAPEPANRMARVSEDGTAVVFVSEASLTGYDNIDANSQRADAEVFLYETADKKLRCISCNPSGGRPEGRQVRSPSNPTDPGDWAAAQIPGWETQWHPSRVLSEEGDRVFFESWEGLVSRDSNGQQDVYEWERVKGEGGAGRAECLDEFGGERYVPSSGGCLSLISSGKSAGEAEFVDASASGSDVFFTTASGLVPQDPGLVDIYDARVEGGFPAPSPPGQECEGGACQSPPAAPEDQTPASSSFEGRGNAKAKRHHKRKHKHHKRHKRHHRGAQQ